MTLRREVCAAAAGAGSEREFFARLEQAGVLVRKRLSTVHPGEVTGYAVGLADHTTEDGSVIWYGGGKLAADLTLPKPSDSPAAASPITWIRWTSTIWVSSSASNAARPLAVPDGDLLRGLEDVGQPLVVTPHRATASRSTRSRIRSFSPPGVATWVITPSSSSTPKANPAMSK